MIMKGPFRWPIWLSIDLWDPRTMLVGFFTYKPASVFQAFRDILDEESRNDDVEWVVDPYGDEEEEEVKTA